ncbi:MAG TPA: cell division protein FtsH [Cyanobacteria bacterium UBA11149]|nr:cell division protein FtsH [Cyanobacteria bacterium UBA11367]HBE56589.1 cell division protein FtsH [Cyanobacteria bacterium UBA11366]HBK65289.1 cell division protein FtsH [Cyanobacteria bacterium UBA11166]HBR75183.1 cell division protein FtsH [Cyanobacteria bacterium UBA11159]HBS72156.1 cell division protein FtsH [Cyanobacteria bacterium UBA11153]HBW92382.1 cell division protein FtsH [Cyanobacteria bacterium UBA11149]HCA93262.1 cell division protein FtsH [Cyanobacteria bacterium UBA9226]
MSIKKKPKSPRIPQIGYILLILAGVSFLGYLFIPRSPKFPRVPYSSFLDQVEEGKVLRVKMGDNQILYQLKNEDPLKAAQELLRATPDPIKGTEKLLQPTPNSTQGTTSTEKLLQPTPSALQPTPSPLQTNRDQNVLTQPQEPQGPIYETIPVNDPDLAKKLREKKVEFFALPPAQESWFSVLLSWVIPPIILVAAFQFFMKRTDVDGQSLSFSKSKAKVYVEGESAKITFADVAGADEAKVELVEIVEFLKDPQRFTEIGARIPKGVLLVGPPGTGKTLLAKAVAGEAGVSFFSISASEFVELFVGTGAARVRDLFVQAKTKAPCIIFIDELDAIGKSRSSGNSPSGGNDEREQTLNQLLTEMDGFAAGNATVIVLAATNRPESLDRALLRPGRFDRQVLVDRPDLVGREAILNVYARKVKLADDIDLHKIAARTPGFAGADLANLVNEAALLAARARRETVSAADFAEAIERVIAGSEKKSRVLNEKEKKIVAYHEVGHALVGALMPGTGKVAKISIVPRGMSALGYTLQLPTEDRFLMNEAELRGDIATLLGGRVAEEIIFGDVTTGASNDLQRATDVAERMVTTYGMGKVMGPLAYDLAPQNNFLGNGVNIRRNVSEETAKAIDKEVKEIVETAHQMASDILNHNRDLLESIAQEILKTEVIEGEELQNWLSQVKPVDPVTDGVLVNNYNGRLVEGNFLG